MRGNLTTIAIGILVALASWVPLWIVEANDPYGMPVGLGLLALAFSAVGGLIALFGLIQLIVRVARASRTPS